MSETVRIGPRLFTSVNLQRSADGNSPKHGQDLPYTGGELSGLASKRLNT